MAVAYCGIEEVGVNRIQLTQLEGTEPVFLQHEYIYACRDQMLDVGDTIV